MFKLKLLLFMFSIVVVMLLGLLYKCNQRVEFYPEDSVVTCQDGVDNDWDCLVDCNDSGCKNLEVCL